MFYTIYLLLLLFQTKRKTKELWHFYLIELKVRIYNNTAIAAD